MVISWQGYRKSAVPLRVFATLRPQSSDSQCSIFRGLRVEPALTGFWDSFKF